MWAALHQQLGTAREVPGRDFCSALLLCHFWQLVKGYCAVQRAGMWDCESRRVNRDGCACGIEAESRSVEWAGMWTRKGTTVIGEIKKVKELNCS